MCVSVRGIFTKDHVSCVYVCVCVVEDWERWHVHTLRRCVRVNGEKRLHEGGCVVVFSRFPISVVLGIMNKDYVSCCVCVCACVHLSLCVCSDMCVCVCVRTYLRSRSPLAVRRHRRLWDSTRCRPTPTNQWWGSEGPAAAEAMGGRTKGEEKRTWR